jgi:hypothetical protein
MRRLLAEIKAWWGLAQLEHVLSAEPTPIAGDLWELLSLPAQRFDPWGDGQASVIVKIHEVKDGWVRYGHGTDSILGRTIFSDCRKPVAEFVRVYRLKKEAARG